MLRGVGEIVAEHFGRVIRRWHIEHCRARQLAAQEVAQIGGGVGPQRQHVLAAALGITGQQ